MADDNVVESATSPTVSSAAEIVQQERSRSRNYSFLHKKPDTLDEVECGDKTFSIPAQAGCSYWAILKVCYERADKPITVDQLCDCVAELMTDRDEEKWERYCGKSKTTVYHKLEQKRNVQKTKPWQERIINNAKTLTRLGGNSKYGLRLYERGHQLCFEHDDNDQPYFILRTDISDLKQKKKKRRKPAAADTE